MSYMKKQVMMMVCVLLAVMSLRAQTTLQIIDLQPIPMMVLDSTGTGIDTNQVKLHIGFKINDVSQAKTAHVLLGTTSGASDIALLAADVVESGGLYALELSSTSFNMSNNYAAYLDVVLTTAVFRTLKSVALYVEDNGSVNTATLQAPMN